MPEPLKTPFFIEHLWWLFLFIEDSLFLRGSGIAHHGDLPEEDEELSASLEKLIVLLWFHFIHMDLPGLLKQR